MPPESAAHLRGTAPSRLVLAHGSVLGRASGRAFGLPQLLLFLEKEVVLKVRWRAPSCEGRAGGWNHSTLQIFPGCVFTNIYYLKFICSFFVSLLLCFVILGCDLLQNIPFGSFAW